MIDVNKELKRMADEFGLTEKEVATSFRADVRNLWGKSLFKKDFYGKRGVKVKNDNPRSMKRFPYVTRYTCNICGGSFSAAETELDHLDSENAMTDLSHAESFIKTIFFTSPSKLQILCKDKKKKVKGKVEVVKFGCHSVLTYSERYGVSFEEAAKYKEFLNISKSDEKTIDFIVNSKVNSVPKTKKARKELLKELMLGETIE